VKIFISLFLFFFFSLNARSQCCCGTAGSGSLSASPGEAPSLFPGARQWIAEMQGEYRSYRLPVLSTDNHSSTALLRELSAFTAGIRYGFTEKIAASLHQPYLLLSTNQGAHRGHGDLLLLGHYRAIEKGSLRLVFSGGCKFPTGEKAGGQTPFVTGTASFDPVAGLLVQIPGEQFSLLGSAYWRHAGESANAMRFGDAFTHGIAFIYGKNNLSCTTDSAARPALSCSAGLSGERLFPQEQGVGLVENTGSYTVSANAGCALRFGK